MSIPVKMEMIFGAIGGYGWVEIHYFNDPSSTLPNLAADMAILQAQIVSKRAALLGQDCQIEGVRASYKTAAGTIASVATAQTPYKVGQSGTNSLSQNDSLAINLYDSTNTRHKILHLRGFWSTIVAGDEYQPQFDARWGALMSAYTSALIGNNFGWLSGTTPVIGQVSSYAINNNDTVTFTVLPVKNAAGYPAVGSIWPVRFSKINNSKSVLNRTLVCQILSPTTMITVNPIATGIWTGVGQFSINVSPTFTGYNNVQTISLGERRMGRPIGRYPGRRSRRARV
jgi:hypothetical protein